MAHEHGHHHQHGQPSGDLAEILDLDAEVLRDYYAEVIGWAGSLVGDRPRIVDLGAGTGVGTIALARHLPTAEVTAVDMDEEMLAGLRHRADAAGVGDRVRTVQADLDGDWPALGPADLVWASASMHHLADPARTLARVHDVVRPGGAFMISELDAFPRFLTDPAGVALEQRAHDELALMRREHGMHMGEDWGALLKTAGFALEGERRFDIELRPPLPASALRYAQATLQRTVPRLVGRLSADEVAGLTAYAENLADRDDLVVRSTRMVWIGRRP
ncbi:class I SAM-dependent methyltransferase [Actinoplanes awajinensis]|uniref:Methyltransferase domain-containing protein n=1 Tax=Actinoplanes awajinensis subsp. mycoplanecinus TaxID=135947 RepID=A0A124GA34_9ACTN|nr:class I SAM-dependent methyltransferase [Actinoplanes awajinensis]KUL30997.1 hypothetical protein ADL15_23945 [Actinoplanes awajinensis subsp. mycoplanecinus]